MANSHIENLQTERMRHIELALNFLWLLSLFQDKESDKIDGIEIKKESSDSL